MYCRSSVSLIYLVGCVLHFTQDTQAQNSTARFLLWQPSAVSNAMGGVGTSLYGDAFAAYYNPAALAFAKSVTLSGSFVKPLPFFGDIAHSYFAASYRSNSFGTIAASANLFWRGAQVITSELDPTPLGGIDEFDWSGKISYALPIRKDLAVGASLSLLRINLLDFDIENQRPIGGERGNGNATAIMFDLGILFKNLLTPATYSPSGRVSDFIEKLADVRQERGLSLGLSLLNSGAKVFFIDHAQADHLPTRLRLGLAYWPIQSTTFGFMLASDFEKQLYESSKLDYIHFGGEAKLLSLFCVQGGYFFDTFGSKNSNYTLGGGVHTKYLSVNLARYTRAILPSWHVDGTLSMAL